MTIIGSPADQTVWEGTPQTLTALATQGKVQSVHYRLTPFTLHIERGLVRTDSQQIPLASVYDIDVRQSMTQKARGVGDIVIHVNTGAHAESVTLEAVREPKQLRDLINQTVARAKQHFVEQGRTQVNVAPASPSPVPTSTASSASPIEQLKELAGLRDAGILTEEEFASEKAKLLGR